MAFYDKSSALRGMSAAREKISNAIAAQAAAKGNIAKAVANTIGDVASTVMKGVKANYDDNQRRKSLIDALKKGGASEEIVNAASSVKDTKDLLPMVALISNPKNTVSVGHSGGQQLIKDTFTGKERNIGTTWQNSSLKGLRGGGASASTYLPSGDNRNTILAKDPAMQNRALQSGVISIDKDGGIKVNDLGALDNIIAQGYEAQQQQQLASQMPRIQAENQRVDGNIKDFLKLQEELKKNKPLIFGDSNSFFKR